MATAPDFPPAWAGGWGEDARGFYAALVVNAVSIELRWIPPGTFLMGSPEREPGRWDDEGPQHQVTLSKGFWLSSTPCTQEEYEAVIGRSPSHFEGKGHPVDSVSWHDSLAFCRKLTALAVEANALPSDFEFRLPTEAEWEYACRAGTTSAFNDGSECTNPGGKDPALKNLGWHGEGSQGRTHPAGELKANEWGLQDMHGNVLEWCLDGQRAYSAQAELDPVGPTDENAGRVLRGGSCWGSAGICRSAYRDSVGPGYLGRDVGFRLAAGQPVKSGATGLEAGGAAAPGPRDEVPAGRPDRAA